ncbi:STAS domain-containing protein [Deinococcus sedimenti]|uniref:Anti-sigma factor antagonist n=1 Tax=Deinococcus sedimenti TaxID=1867090 RepID=A0ABQ2SA48_9DEIO|nr:STAS domain-containing protein [Deinococcus sedimenti]GGS01407.1 hypothetical protein GCM10008960_30110 [Deinococcus sedimenti]
MPLTHLVNGPELTLSGRLDAQNAQELRAALTALAAAPGDLRVDLADVPFMDSSALAALVSALKDRRREGRSLRVTRASPAVQELMSLTMLGRVFGLEEPR